VEDLLTAKPEFRLAIPPSARVTVTVRFPVVALAAIWMVAARRVAETKRQALTVIPAPKLHRGPLVKFLPWMVTLSVAP
jgi:hypothetical protein